jgi:hypothetical protein
LEALSAREPPIAALIAQVLEQLGEFELRLFRERVWSATRRTTLDELAKQKGVTRERIRQIEGRAVDKLLTLLAHESFAPINDRAFELRARLGNALPLKSTDLIAATRWATRDLDPFGHDGWLLLTWLAGPYRESNGWLELREGRTQGAVTVDGAPSRAVPSQARSRRRPEKSAADETR